MKTAMGRTEDGGWENTQKGTRGNNIRNETSRKAEEEMP